MGKRILSLLLCAALTLCLVPALQARATTGYDRGYTGAMAGDGIIYAHGLDVSDWQGASLDFQNFKNAGYDYVILRCGTTKGKDKCFETYYTKAKAAGLDVGVYYYSYATSVEGAKSDAANVLSWISGKLLEYPVYFDYEDSSQSGIDATTAANICYAFLDTLKAEGYLMGLYSMASWLEKSWVTTSGLRDTYEGWVAHYPSTDSNTGMTSGVYQKYHSTYSSRYGMYQYSASTYVNGAGAFDCNVCYKDYPAIVKTYGFNGYSPTNGHTVSFESNGGSKVDSVFVEDGKTLTAPNNPTRYGFNFAGWYCDPELNDPYDFSTPVPYSFTLFAKWEEAYWGANTNLLPVEGLLQLEDYQSTGQYIWPYYNADGSVTMYNGVTNDANWSWPSAWMNYENSFDSGNDAYLYVKYSASANFNAAIDYLDSDGNPQSVKLSRLAGNGDTDFPAGDAELLLNLGQYIYDQGHLTTSDGSVHSRNVKYTKVTYYVVGGLDTYVRIYDLRLTPCHSVSFETGGGSPVDAVAVARGASLTAPTPTRLGFDFAGWYWDAALTKAYEGTPITADATLYARWESAQWETAGSLLPVSGKLQYVGFQETGESVWDYYNDDGSVTLYNTVDGADYSWPSGYMEFENTVDLKATPNLHLNFRCDYGFNGEITYLDETGAEHTVNLSTLADLETTDFTAGTYDLSLDFASYIEAQGHMPSDGILKLTRVTYYVVGVKDSYARLYDLSFCEAKAVPQIKLSYPTVSFEDMVCYNIYYTATETEQITEMGILVFDSLLENGTHAEATQVFPGYERVNDLFVVHTGGIAAKKMGDSLYFRVYAKLTDGSYVYSKAQTYSILAYAQSVLNGSYSTATKALVVAALNYGAEAQKLFSYRTDSLMNSSLTASQQALVEAYRSDMMDTVPAAEEAKAGIFTKTDGFSRKYPTVTFEGAFCINYHFVPSATPTGDMKLYYWTQADYEAAETLTPANASGSVTAVCENGVYTATVEGIAAKDLDKGIYVAAGYTYDGGSHCTGILAYSIGTYCTASAAGSDTAAALAAATAVYGYYAKGLFY